MKPTRNRYYCIAARRVKMLFETESQADNFIKFNSNEMEELGGKAPVRSYYCPLCMGWHVTSNPNVSFFETHPSRAESTLNRIIAEKAAREFDKAEQPIRDGKILESQGRYDEACLGYLAAFHQIKKDSSKSDFAMELLTKGFEDECRLVMHIIQSGKKNDGEFCKPAKRCFKLLKRASSNCRQQFADYIETLTPIVESFPNPVKSNTQEIPEKELTEEEAREKEMRRQERIREKQEKKLYDLRRQIGSIKANMIAGQRSESRMLIQKSIREIQELSSIPEFRNEIIELIDELMTYRKEYGEQFEI